MNKASTILQDARIHTEISEENVILSKGLQPFMFKTTAETLIVQAQLPEKPYGTRKMVYPYKIETVISRDGGKKWETFKHLIEKDEIFIEGGITQLKDGTILALDTYVVQSDQGDYGIGELATSKDDWRTLKISPAVFEMTNLDIASRKDDGGDDHEAARLHRSLLELPDGDLLVTMYSWFYGDDLPVEYMPVMKKARTILYRSSDQGHSWRQVGSVVDTTNVGTEGFVEPVLLRLSHKPHEGRLICLMRTGREMHSIYSDDEGLTWSIPRVENIGGIDVNRTDLWADQFQNIVKDGSLNHHSELHGMYANPDLIELHNGTLVCAFGARIPARLCSENPTHPWNGNYLAFSFDQGESWSHVIQLTSGVVTTHYMSVCELKPNLLYVTYDLGAWNHPEKRRVVGRQISLKFREGR